MEGNRGNHVPGGRVGRDQNEREMHGRTGLKWQQSALMETDGRMRR